MGFFVHKSAQISDQAVTGNAIIRVANSVFQSQPGSEWAAFNADTREWLFQNGYRYTGTGELPDGRIPKTIDIVPVYDTPTKMHVRVPWAGDLVGGTAPVTDDYGRSFPAFLARYFVRRCR